MRKSQKKRRMRRVNPLVKSYVPGMLRPPTRGRSISFRIFEERVRQFNPDLIIPFIADVVPSRADEKVGPDQINLHELAQIARVSLEKGDPSSVTAFGEAELVHLVQSCKDIKQFNSAPNLTLIKVRTAVFSEQLPWQENDYDWICRYWILYVDTYDGFGKMKIDSPDKAFLNSAPWEDVLGLPLKKFIGVLWMIYAQCLEKQGRVTEDHTHIDFSDSTFVELGITVSDYLLVLESLTWEMSDLRDWVAENIHDEIDPQFQVNPLLERPIIRLRDGRLIAPFPRYILNRVTDALYFIGLQSWESGETRGKFPNSLGHAFNLYVSDLLSLLNPSCWHEILLNQAPSRTRADFIVVHENVGFILECKAKRLTKVEKAGIIEAEGKFDAIVGQAIIQINETFEDIQQGLNIVDRNEVLNSIQEWRSLVVLLDPIYTANEILDAKYKDACHLPVSVISVADLERLTATPDLFTFASVITMIQDSLDLRVKIFHDALVELEVPRSINPIIENAWSRMPFH